jgi:hypothetical protein
MRGVLAVECRLEDLEGPEVKRWVLKRLGRKDLWRLEESLYAL